MPENAFELLKTKVLRAMEKLSPHLSYHSVSHTLDVIRQAGRIAKDEGISDERSLFLLSVAALYHDTGFLVTYSGHEEKSCELFLRDITENHGAGWPAFTAEEIKTICGLIMATRIPQQPKTPMEKIICDADLDYLGRDDFEQIGNTLKKEFLHYGIVADEESWDRLQLNFLGNHHYHTASSQRQREPVKQAHYRALL